MKIRIHLLAAVLAAALLSCDAGLQNELDELKDKNGELKEELAERDAQIAALRETLEGKEADIAAVEAQITALETRKTALEAALAQAEGDAGDLEAELAAVNAALDAKAGELAGSEAAVTFMTRQISLMEAGGKKRDADWFARSDAIAANARSMGGELVTVFLGDGLIIEAVGNQTEEQIKAAMPNIPTARVHVAAMDGATVEEIIWGITRGGWLPTKTAYTVIHAGRAEVEANYAALSGGAAVEIAYSIGMKIGGIYTAVVDKTTDQSGNPSSVIFSGIIPENPINSYNIGYINGNDGIKYGDFGTAIDNSYIKMITPNSSDTFKTIANAFINNQPTYVAGAVPWGGGIFLAGMNLTTGVVFR
ncbi:MAG: hypothetical protein LBQ14_06310 [Treponema sp.]|jgi:FtsZ-binding cell division protein ZapB|nr:hypothetical protein [Treponema sp.]